VTKILNPNIEIRNKSEIQMIKFPKQTLFIQFRILKFVHLKLFRISNFVLRICSF
jgi:hypothetical protein